MDFHESANADLMAAFEAEISGVFDESTRLPDRLERYAFARQRALINALEIESKLHVVGMDADVSIFAEFDYLWRISSILQQCGDYLGFKNYYTVGKCRLTAANFCRVHLLCPLCAIRRGSKFLDAYLTRYAVIKSHNPHLQLSMLTLTIKNGHDLPERFNHLRVSIQKLLERRRKALAGARGWHSEFSKIAGLVGSVEFTKGQLSGWHPHAHLMVLHEQRFNYEALQGEWLKITGDSHVLRVDAARHPHDPAQDFLEVFKYALKFSDLTPDQNLHAYHVMRRKRLLFSAGLFWGVEVPDEMTDLPLDNLPYMELFYKYLPRSGYNLTRTHDIEIIQPVEYLKPVKGFKTARRSDSSKPSLFDHFQISPDIIAACRVNL